MFNAFVDIFIIEGQPQFANMVAGLESGGQTSVHTSSDPAKYDAYTQYQVSQQPSSTSTATSVQTEWSEGQVTEYLVATFGDYFTDIKMYIEERSFRRFVESCLEETVVIYVDHLLTQKNYIKEETIERMRLDEEVVMDFFREYISVSKVENRLQIMSDLRELASAESPDSFTLIYTNILEHHPDCPAEVVEKIVGMREGIPRKDAKEVVQECKEIYENSLVDGNPPKTGFVFPNVKCLSASKASLWRNFKG